MPIEVLTILVLIVEGEPGGNVGCVIVVRFKNYKVAQVVVAS